MTDNLNFPPDFWPWVHKNKSGDTAKLLLASNSQTDINLREAVKQIECRSRFGKKLSDTLSRFENFYFPSFLSGEQATGDLLATYHATLIDEGVTVVDLTAGLGIDALHLAAKASSVIAIERNVELAKALEYNAKGLNISNIRVIHGDCVQLAEDLKGDIAFIDPARRAGDGSRVFGLKDCEPDIIGMLPILRRNFKTLILKASPMLDISKTIEDLPGVSNIYAIGTSTECKELLAVVNLSSPIASESVNSGDALPEIHAVTVLNEGKAIDFKFDKAEEGSAESTILRGFPQKGAFLFVPYPSVMKTAPVRLLSQRYGLYKFHDNTHLYYGDDKEKAGDFPGDIFEIIDVVSWQSKNLKRFKSKYPNVMVSVRNFGMTAEALRAKLGVREGGKERLRLFGVGLGKDHTDKVLLVCKELQVNAVTP